MGLRTKSVVLSRKSRSSVREAAPLCKVVALGCSAGGLNSLSEVLAPLPAGFPGGILIVQHLSPDHPSLMAQLLMRRIGLRVQEAKDGDRIIPGLVYIAPPN